MVKEPHFTPKKMLSMLGLQSDSLGPYALIPGPKERSQMLLGMLKDAAKNFSFLDYEMHTGTIDGKRVTVGRKFTSPLSSGTGLYDRRSIPRDAGTHSGIKRAERLEHRHGHLKLSYHRPITPKKSRRHSRRVGRVSSWQVCFSRSRLSRR